MRVDKRRRLESRGWTAGGVRESLDLSPEGVEAGIPIRTLRPGIDDLFRSWGIALGKDILGSRECSSVTVVTKPQRNFPANFPRPIRMRVLVKAAGGSIRPLALTSGIQAQSRAITTAAAKGSSAANTQAGSPRTAPAVKSATSAR